MINFRYHVVSIIGIFIALAVGVVLGGQTPRRGEIGHFQIGSLSSSRTISSGMGSSSARTNESHASSSKWRT